MERKRTNELDNAVGQLKLKAGIDKAKAESLLNSSQGAFIISKALCLAIEGLDATDPDVENMILLRDQLFPLYLLSESGISESVVAYGSMEAIVETLEAMEEKLRGQDDS
tara:strand:- start:614 stop:943 length:330 start_codon:yes stop_codon:yes gene_type:complete